MMNLEELFRHGQEFARSTFNACGQFTPMWVGITEDDEILPILVPEFPSKDIVVAAIKKIFKERKVVRYVQMLEGWMVVTKSSAEAERQAREYIESGLSLETHPDRVEVLTVEASDGVRTLMGYFRIIREEAPELSEFESHPDAQAEGRFVNLLGRPTRH